MTIYVDTLLSWGWRMRGRTVDSCHMFTDSPDLEELHLFAERIGLRRDWFQNARVAPHYDLTPSRRLKAVALGAVEVLDRRQASQIWRARREAVAHPPSIPTQQGQLPLDLTESPPCMTIACDSTASRWPGNPEVLTKFDTEAFIKPKTRADVLALLDEALNEVRHLNKLWGDVITRCERGARGPEDGPNAGQ